MTELSLQQSPSVPSVFSAEGFAQNIEVAKALAASDIVPAGYRGNIPNVLIAMDISNRMNVSPLVVMQGLDVIQGKPRWSGKYCAAMLAANGIKFKYEKEDRGEKEHNSTKYLDMGCRVIGVVNGETVEGPWVTLQMAHLEGWVAKSGSKWKTMPDLMIMYRAVTFFVNTYVPHITMGIPTFDEIDDIHDSPGKKERAAAILSDDKPGQGSRAEHEDAVIDEEDEDLL